MSNTGKKHYEHSLQKISVKAKAILKIHNYYSIYSDIHMMVLKVLFMLVDLILKMLWFF